MCQVKSVLIDIIFVAEYGYWLNELSLQMKNGFTIDKFNKYPLYQLKLLIGSIILRCSWLYNYMTGSVCYGQDVITTRHFTVNITSVGTDIPHLPNYTSAVGVTKDLFVNFSVSRILDMAKIHVKFFESLPLLTGVTAAQLRWHLPNVNVIFNS